jgi:L-fuculose-phosphate aldolase
MDYEKERRAICAAGRALYRRGYVAGSDGNLSVRVGENRLLITPSGVGKGRLRPEMLLLTDLDGRVLEGDRHPSSEGKMHLEVYRTRPDVRAVVHAHPPVATAFAVCRRAMDVPYIAELVLGLGTVPVTAGFAMPSTDQVTESMRPFIPEHNAVLLANHGLVCWGESLLQAFDRLETVEHVGKILMNAQALGGAVALTEEETNGLLSLRGMYKELGKKREEGRA